LNGPKGGQIVAAQPINTDECQIIYIKISISIEIVFSQGYLLGYND
jgi:hypothetical protein